MIRQYLIVSFVFLFAASALAEPSVHTFRTHPDASIAIDTNRASMNKSWPNRGYPDHIGMLDRPRRYVYIAPMLWSDRTVYLADEPVAQFFALFPEQEEESQRLIVRLKSRTGDTVAKAEHPIDNGKVSFLANLDGLAPGTYTMQVNWTPPGTLKPTWQVTRDFEVSAKTNNAPKFPEQGIAITQHAQDVMQNGTWPMTIGVPLPRGAVYDVNELSLGDVPCDIDAVARWGPGDGASIKWVHLRFAGKYDGGKPVTYYLRKVSARPASNLKVQESAEAITVDTGAIRFQVNRKRFNGIAAAWVDGQQIVDASPEDGAYLVDEKGTRHTAAADGDVKVSIEHQGSAAVTIAAEGWYVDPSDPSDRLCKFTTRITAYANQPWLRVSHNTYLTFDTWQRQLADLAFTVPAKGGTQYRFGADGKTHEGAIGNEPVYAHQERWNRYRVIDDDRAAGGAQLDGWFSTSTGVSVVLRDVWQKYPKEAGIGRAGITLHFWPRHGRDVFTQHEQLQFDNIYKFLAFHHGALMDLKTPDVYVKKFSDYAADKASHKEGSHGWWRESEHDATRDGRATGAVIANEFAVHFAKPQAAVEPFANMFMLDPSASAPPTWNASTGALGPMAAAIGDQFADMEEALVEGWLGWGEGMVARYADYGMWNYGDTHTVHLVDEQRPGLHRIWQGSHYHNMGANWVLYHRTGDPRILQWARKNVDHYLNIDMTNYVDEQNPVPVRDHVLGGMQHMGWKTHWASSGEAWGQYKDVWGHFIDGDGMLWAWYHTANPRAIENYRNWYTTLQSNLLGHYRGTAREVNNSLANIITAYTATWDPTWIPIIYEIADALADTPLEKQRPGPLWHPLWINRYHDLTRDARYEPLITHYADYFKGGVESTWPIALAAKAYDISGDERFLTMHLDAVRDWPRKFYRKQGDPYHWFGKGDGPLGGHYGYLTWGNYLLRLQRAGITELPPHVHGTPLGGAYPYTSARWNYPNQDPSCLIYGVATDSEPVVVNMGLGSLGGSLHATHAQLFSPDGQLAWEVERVGSGDDHNEPRTAPGRPGLWRLEYHGHEARVPAPQTNLPYEAMLIRPDVTYKTANLRGYMQPLDPNKPIRLTISAVMDDAPLHVLVYDANDKLHLDVTLLRPRPGSENRVLTLHPRAKPAPWRIDTCGMTAIKTELGGEVLIASTPQSLEAVARELTGSNPNERKAP